MFTDQTDDETLSVVVWPVAYALADIYWSGEKDGQFIQDRRILFEMMRFNENNITINNIYTWYNTKSGQHTLYFHWILAN